MTADDAKLRLLEIGPRGLKKPRKSSPVTKTVSEPELGPITLPSYNFLSTEEETEQFQNVVFRPNPGPQTTFLEAGEREVLYGGGAGSGKSFALLADARRDLDHPDFRGLIVRRTTEELRELVQKSQQLYLAVNPKYKWSERKMEWTSPAGGTLWMSYLERDEDVTRYQGQAFNYIAFDELTQWPTPYAWDYMRSRLRSASDYFKDKLYQRATSNPGSAGHSWVKKMFIDPAPWGEAFVATNIETGQPLLWPKGSRFEGQPLFKRRFVPARLSDNPYLYDDGAYEANLLSLPEVERKRLLDGNWDVMSGAAFPEWNREIHVIEPFEIPTNWTKFRACDYGYGSFSAVLWFAVVPDGSLIVYRELYVSKTLAVDLADMILDQEQEDGRVSYGVLDSSLWHKRGDNGPSLAEQMIARGCLWRPSDRSKGTRVAGKNEVHRRLQTDEFTGRPRILFFNNCTETISQLPVIQLDKKNPEDVDTNGADHIYDALRYGIMSRPQASHLTYERQAPQYQPIDEVFGY